MPEKNSVDRVPVKLYAEIARIGIVDFIISPFFFFNGNPLVF